MKITEISDTKYYEFDWYVPYEENNKVYLAIRGIIDKKSKLPLMECGGVGYDWQEEKQYKMREITKEEFLEKADNYNILYFSKNINNCNNLLNYPPQLQKVVDRELYYSGFKTHGTLSISEKLKILKEKQQMKKQFRKLER